MNLAWRSELRADAYRPSLHLPACTGTHYTLQSVPGTSLRAGGEARPMTSVSGAGYQSKKQGTFDPLNQGHGPAPALAEKSDNGPEYLARDMERQVNLHFSSWM